MSGPPAVAFLYCSAGSSRPIPSKPMSAMPRLSVAWSMRPTVTVPKTPETKTSASSRPSVSSMVRNAPNVRPVSVEPEPAIVMLISLWTVSSSPSALPSSSYFRPAFASPESSMLWADAKPAVSRRAVEARRTFFMFSLVHKRLTQLDSRRADCPLSPICGLRLQETRPPRRNQLNRLVQSCHSARCGPQRLVLQGPPAQAPCRPGIARIHRKQGVEGVQDMAGKKVKTAVAATALFALAACGGDQTRGIFGLERDREREFEAMRDTDDGREPGRFLPGSEREGGFFSLFGNNTPPDVTVEVNKYLWNASLEVLSFLPIQTVDPFSGVIVTGFGRPPGGGRAYRATILVQDPALDARSLTLSLQTQSGAASAETVRAVENAILTRARQLRIRDADL